MLMSVWDKDDEWLILVGKECFAMKRGEPITAHKLDVDAPSRLDTTIYEVWLNAISVMALTSLGLPLSAKMITRDEWQAKTIFDTEAGRMSIKDGWRTLCTTLA